MARVLVIDDDSGTLFGFKQLLRLSGHQVATAALGEDGIAAALRDRYDVVLCDQRLPDIPGLAVVRAISAACTRTNIVLMTAWGSQQLFLEAKHNGAKMFVEKPLIGDELIKVVDEALSAPPDSGPRDEQRSNGIGYAERRWADLVARGVYLAQDPKTIPIWSRAIGIAPSTLKSRCEAAGVSPKSSVDLIRLLRIVVRYPGEPWDLQRRLDIVDARTANALLDRAGFESDTASARVPSLPAFMSMQRLITRATLVSAVLERLAGH